MGNTFDSCTGASSTWCEPPRSEQCAKDLRSHRSSRIVPRTAWNTTGSPGLGALAAVFNIKNICALPMQIATSATAAAAIYSPSLPRPEHSKEPPLKIAISPHPTKRATASCIHVYTHVCVCVETSKSIRVSIPVCGLRVYV